MNIESKGRVSRILADIPLHRPSGYSPTLEVQEKRVWVIRPSGSPEQFLSNRQIGAKRFCSILTKRHQSFLLSFPSHFHKTLAQCHIFQVQANQLADSHSCRIQHLENGAIANPSIGLISRQTKDNFHFFARKKSRLRLVLTGCSDQASGIDLDDAFLMQKAKKGSQSCQFPGNRAPLLATLVKVAEKLANA